VIVENVKEFITWGPLYKSGPNKNRPIKKQKGKYFRKWLADLRALGYTVDYKILNCADYGDATTRRRLFVQAVKDGKSILWPQPTHFEGKSWRMAKDIIDWTLPSESIFSRKRPLAKNTLKRIEAGIQKYWGKYAEPFLVVLRGTSDRKLKITNRSIREPLTTISAGGGHIGLLEPFIFSIGQMGATSHRLASINQPLSTIVTKQEHCLVTPFIVQYYGNGLARNINLPLDTVTTKDRFALIDGCPVTLDIRFRMLQPHELSAGQGFPKEYKFAGTKTEIVKQIGNAVPHYMAKALALTALKERVAE
jgi:DNA (cytosine-5)-methyltransferase 1